MSSLFKKKIGEAFPIAEKYFTASENGLIQQYYYLKNKRKSEWDDIKVSYLEETTAYLEKCKRSIPNRILIISDNEMIAMKSAAYMKAHYEEYRNLYEEEDDEFEEDDGLEFLFEKKKGIDTAEMLRVVDFSKGNMDEKIPVNKYLHLISGVSGKDVVFFRGLSGEDRKEVQEVIGVCPAVITCVFVTPEQFSSTWVQELRIDFHFDVLRLSPLKNTYYEQVLEYLLEDEKYKFSKELSGKRFLNMIRKKRGNQFKEEDIAWYLDKAVEKMKKGNSKSTMLKEEHFPDLFTEGKKPMEQLQEMTGLENVKRIAKEIAALTKEELQNEKLGIFHKNMIFYGNPGTGKTTVAKLLADIMAEEGNSNANFVATDRKSLIGKYVGHTAPKVAQKFEEARGGILFVDEAGFFLNAEAGGFAAEAMKEFIRYMELYPDVTVIFAMYSNEVLGFLELDEGLSSRISHFVKFEDYQFEELTEITKKMLQEKGYEVSQETMTAIQENMKKIKAQKKKKFGNAREARNLAESMIITASLRQYEAKKREAVITIQDVENGYKRMNTEMEKKQTAFGFYGRTEGKNMNLL